MQIADMHEFEILFLRTLEDIERRLTQEDPYEILLIAGLIRKLFLDDHPLIDQINKKYKIKLLFDIGIPKKIPNDFIESNFWSWQDGVDPNSGLATIHRHTVNRDQFFKVIVMLIEGHQYSIKEIILFEANVMGGVHAGSPKCDKECILKEFGPVLTIGGLTSHLRQLKSIARVILKTITPLKTAVKASSQ